MSVQGSVCTAAHRNPIMKRTVTQKQIRPAAAEVLSGQSCADSSATSAPENDRSPVSQDADVSSVRPGDLQAAADVHSGQPLKFSDSNDFLGVLRQRVDEYFRTTGLPQRDCPQMYVKTLIIFCWFAVSYVLLVFFATEWWQALPLSISLGLAMAAIGFNIQHDGGHQAYSNHAWVNRLMALTLDLMGGSSYAWDRKHNSIHHTYANITGHDDDINIGFLGRLSPHQKRLKFHRLQHIYLWLLYGVMTVKWQVYDDFRDVIRGQIEGQPFVRPKGWSLFLFVAGKLVFCSLAFVIPMLQCGVGPALLCYGLAAFVQGLTLSVVFQLAHVVEGANFPLPDCDTGRIENAWAVHQVQTTVDFSRHSRLIGWLTGGLNFQIEHHLFPRICHVNYPAISRLVEVTCREFEIKYMVHETFFAGVRSHFRWLRQMGMPETT